MTNIADVWWLFYIALIVAAPFCILIALVDVALDKDCEPKE